MRAGVTCLQSRMAWARRRFALLALAMGLTALVHTQGTPAPGAVVVAELDGIIHPIAAEYLTEVIDQADRTVMTLVIIQLLRRRPAASPGRP